MYQLKDPKQIRIVYLVRWVLSIVSFVLFVAFDDAPLSYMVAVPWILTLALSLLLPDEYNGPVRETKHNLFFKNITPVSERRIMVVTVIVVGAVISLLIKLSY